MAKRRYGHEYRPGFPKPLHAHPSPADIIRFCKKITLTRDGNKTHWIWTAYTDDKGYGQFRFKRKTVWAHRFAALVFKGLLEGHEANHECQTPGCVNPSHMNGLTKTDNTVEGNRRKKRRKNGTFKSGPRAERAVEKAQAELPDIW